MRIVFLSNYFNHHQSALSDALWRETEGQYLFIEGQVMPEERKQLGCGASGRAYVMPLRRHERQAIRAVLEADVVVAGSAPEWLVQIRVRSGKLLLRYAERPLKNGPELCKFWFRYLRWHGRNPGKAPIYLLCASAYTAGDYEKFGLFRGKTYKWGYFPETKRYETEALMNKKDTFRVLWCGRLIESKHPEDALYAVKKLQKEGYSVTLELIGGGPMEEMLRELAKTLEPGSVRFSGVLCAEKVRRAMEKAGVFLFTSDAREGWGAVLNEAMNSGCAVIASRAAGATPFLVKQGENGFAYPYGDREYLTEKLRYLLQHPEVQRSLGAAAYCAIRDIWNAEEAAKRLVALAGVLAERKTAQALFSEGPCSPAGSLEEMG